MDICVKLFIFTCVALCVSVEAKLYIDDYSWRDYDGTVPFDAFEAGTDKDGQTLYLGQVLHESKVIPGKIYAGDNKVYFEFYNIEYRSNLNIKILCAHNKDTFQWIPTQHTQALNLVARKTLIKGGYEPNCTTYLGRSKIGPGAEVGKVMCCKASEHCYGLYTTSDGSGQLEFDFDILAFNDDDSNDIGTVSSGDRIGTSGVVSSGTPNTAKDKCKQITINMFY